MSAKRVCVQPPRYLTPSIIKRLDPTPEIFAPIELSILQSCLRYGSQAALKIVVLPFAITAAITMFAVPVTEASSRSI